MLEQYNTMKHHCNQLNHLLYMMYQIPMYLPILNRQVPQVLEFLVYLVLQQLLVYQQVQKVPDFLEGLQFLEVPEALVVQLDQRVLVLFDL